MDLLATYSKLDSVQKALRRALAVPLAEGASQRRPAQRVHRLERRLTGDEVAELVDLYRGGTPLAQICETYNMAAPSVRRHVSDAGYPLRAPKMTCEQEQRAIQLYATGLSLAKVGAELGFHPTAINGVLRRHMLNPRPRPGY